MRYYSNKKDTGWDYKMITFDYDKLKGYGKSIFEDVTRNGEVVPMLLDLDLSYNERMSVYRSVSDEVLDRVDESARMQRERCKSVLVTKGLNALNHYEEEELLEFLAKYPKYNDIII